MEHSSENNELTWGKRIIILLGGILMAVMALLFLKDANCFFDYFVILVLAAFSMVTISKALSENKK